MKREVNLIGGFYKDNSLTFSAQDTVNWLPVPDESSGARSPIKLRGLPGLIPLNVEVDQLEIIGDAPNTTCGASYSHTYTTTGGTAPITWGIESGELPEGLTFSGGSISGTVLCTAIEFGEVSSPPFLPTQLTAFNTESINTFPNLPAFQTVGAGIRTILLVVNVTSGGTVKTSSYDAYINGAVVASFGPINYGGDNPRRYFAFDVIAGDTFYITRTSGTGSQTGRFYAYTETIQDLFPGSPVGGDGGGTFEFVVSASDSTGLSATLADSITVTSP